MDNMRTYMPCDHGRYVGKSYAHRITKTKLTLILTLILIPTLTYLTLLALVYPLDSHGSV